MVTLNYTFPKTLNASLINSQKEVDIILKMILSYLLFFFITLLSAYIFFFLNLIIGTFPFIWKIEKKLYGVNFKSLKKVYINSVFMNAYLTFH